TIYVRDRDVSAFPCQGLCGSKTNAARAADDQSCLPMDTKVHVSCLQEDCSSRSAMLSCPSGSLRHRRSADFSAAMPACKGARAQCSMPADRVRREGLSLSFFLTNCERRWSLCLSRETKSYTRVKGRDRARHPLPRCLLRGEGRCRYDYGQP